MTLRRSLIARRIPLTLALALAAIVVGPAVGAFPDAMSVVAVGTLAAIAALAALAGERFDARLYGVLAASWAVARLAFPSVDAPALLLRSASVSALVLLHGVLLIGPWSYFSKRVLALYRHRRRMGVTVFFLALTHATLASRIYFRFSFADEARTVFVFFGVVGIYFLGFLAATAWDRAQTDVPPRAWGFVHGAVLAGYLGLIAAFAAVLRAAGTPVALWVWIFLGATVVFAAAVAPWGPVARRMRVVMGWKQLHLLVWVAWAAVVVHSWMGTVRYLGPFVRYPFAAVVLFVLGSHAVGWRRKLRGEARARSRVAAIGKTLADGGARWTGVARDEEFVPGVGQRFIVDGAPIAVYKVLDRFVALSAVCAHQKGPLDRGTIDRDGYVVCPWHQWRYSTADGCGPPGARGDCVPFHPTKVVDGVVYVRDAAAPCPGGAKPHRYFS